MPSYLIIPNIIAKIPVFNDWLDEFSNIWSSKWIEYNINNENIIFITEEDKIDQIFSEEIGMKLAELLELFLDKNWEGNLVIKMEGMTYLDFPEFEFYTDNDNKYINQNVYLKVPNFNNENGYEFIIKSKIDIKIEDLLVRELKYN